MLKGEPPTRLDDVPREERVYEQFGWQPVVGVLSCLLLLPVVIQEPTIATARPYVILGLVIVAIALGVLEFFRRPRRVALVHVQAGIGVYRRGALDLVAGPQSTMRYKLSWIYTSIFLMAAPMFFVPFLMSYIEGKGEVAFLLAAGLAVLSFASTIYTRILCVHHMIPTENGRLDDIILSRSDLRKHPEIRAMLGYS